MRSIVLLANLKVGLGMGADGADLGGSRTDHDVTAVAALPDGDAALFEDLHSLYILQQRTVALLVGLLNGGNAAELCGELVEALGLGILCHAGVHIRPLGVFTLGGVKQIFGGVAHLTERLEPELCVLLLIGGGL